MNRTDTFFDTFGDANPQRRFDMSVVIPTICRPTLKQAIESIYDQDIGGRVQILIGLDMPGRLPMVVLAPPTGFTVHTFWPGYSTSSRHGGPTPSHDGGALRTVLTYLANSPYVAYLDDDNWWAPNHLSSLRGAIEGKDWTWSLRWLVHPESRLPIAVDQWESCGPGGGLRTLPHGGFVDPSCLMINKTLCRSAPQCWTFPLLENDMMTADCTVYSFLSQMHTHRGTGEATAFYTMNAADSLHRQRVEWIGADNYAEAGQMPDDYAAAMAARVAAYRTRKAEQTSETDAARDAALKAAESYMAALDINAGVLAEMSDAAD